MLEISRWLVAVGATAAAVGFTLWGMATTTLFPMEDLLQLAIILMVGGLVGFIIGMLINRRLDQTDNAPEI